MITYNVTITPVSESRRDYYNLLIDGEVVSEMKYQPGYIYGFYPATNMGEAVYKEAWRIVNSRDFDDRARTGDFLLNISDPLVTPPYRNYKFKISGDEIRTFYLTTKAFSIVEAEMNIKKELSISDSYDKLTLVGISKNGKLDGTPYCNYSRALKKSFGMVKQYAKKTELLVASPSLLRSLAKSIRDGGFNYKIERVTWKVFNHSWKGMRGIGLRVSHLAYESLYQPIKP